MIVRIWRGVTKIEDADEYAGYMRSTGVKDCASTEGNRGATMLRREQDGHAEFLFISFWESLEAIKRFAGEDFETAVYYPDDARYLLELEPKVTHYDVV
jgi:heme-degrading monooxygenase HmoA